MKKLNFSKYILWNIQLSTIILNSNTLYKNKS